MQGCCNMQCSVNTFNGVLYEWIVVGIEPLNKNLKRRIISDFLISFHEKKINFESHTQKRQEKTEFLFLLVKVKK
jgi:hypothetical protein